MRDLSFRANVVVILALVSGHEGRFYSDYGPWDPLLYTHWHWGVGFRLVKEEFAYSSFGNTVYVN